MRNKKAEVASQIFVYIIALVVVGMVIVFGYKAIKNFGSRSKLRQSNLQKENKK